MRKMCIAMLLLILGAAWGRAWSGNTQTSYNIQRALEAANQRDYETSLNFLQQEIKENPTNGYAYAYIAAVCDMLPDFKQVTFHFAKQALPLLPKNEGFLKASMEGLLADIYYEAGDTLHALEHQKQAISYQPADAQYYGRLAGMYEDGEQWQKLHELGYELISKTKGMEGNPLSFIVISTGLQELKRYDEVIDYTQRGLMRPELTTWQEATLHKLQTQALIGNKEYTKALNNAIVTSETLASRGANLLIEIADSIDMQVVVDSVEALILRHENEELLPMVLSDIYAHHNNFQQAIYQLLRSAKIEESAALYYSIGDYYINYMGDAESAESYYKKAISLDSTSASPWGHIAILYHDLGRYEEALRAMEKVLLLDPTQNHFYVPYSYIGRIYRDMHNYDRALDAYYRACVSSGDRDAYTAIAAIYRLQGKDEEARRILQQGLTTMQNDTTMDMLLAIGDTVRAGEKAATMVTNPRSATQQYNAACMYARMNQTEPALAALRKAFECGFRDFYHIAWDDDLDSIRETEAFRLLTEEYKARLREEQAELKNLLQTL